MTTDEYSVTRQITEQIQSYLPAWYGEGATLARFPDLRQRKWSFFLRAEVRRAHGNPVVLLIKIPRLEGMDTLAQAASAADLVPYTEVEYQALARLNDVFEGRPEFRTIRPVAFLPQWNAIVMEELPLQPLKTLLFQPALLLGREVAWQRLAHILEQAGRWLAIFHHQVGQIEPEPISDSKIEPHIQEVIQELVATNTDPRQVKLYETTLQQQLNAFGNIHVPTASLHTDMTYANIFVTPDERVGVLDPGGHIRGPVYADLAVMLTDPRTRSFQVLTAGRALPEKRLAQCRRAILQGYFGSAPYNEKLLDFYCALTILHKWADDERTLEQARGVARVARPWLKKQIRSYFSRQLARCLPLTRAHPPGRVAGQTEIAERVS